ncbi:MAG: hypothetical protein M1387_11950 [Thaumarchaeota archaeon]|nr:hypothetical protein [Nitrososphaerota archaeon]
MAGGQRGAKPVASNQLPPKTRGGRIKWLFSKNGLPTLVTIVVGFIIGVFLDGAVGVVLATVVGLLVLKAFKRLSIPTKPWQALLASVLPIVSRLMFSMVFFLPIADYLWMPSKHTPNTLMKYLSILIVKPENLMATQYSNYFPGLTWIVIVSVVLMLWGSLNLDRRRNLVFAFSGLLLYTLSPTITYAALTGDVTLRIVSDFFAVGYYLGWVGLALFVVSKFLPRLLKTQQPTLSPLTQGKTTLMSFLPLLMVSLFISQIEALQLHLSITTLQIDLSFEEAHHSVASVFSGVFAGAAAAAAVGVVPASEATEESVVPPTESPEPETSTEEGDEPPGTVTKVNPDGTITKILPDGLKVTKYSDGTIYAEAPDGTTQISYPDGTDKTNYPDGTTSVVYPDGREVITEPSGKTITTETDGTRVARMPNGEVAIVRPDGTVTGVKPDGSSITYDAENRIIGKTFGSDNKDLEGISVTINPDGSMKGTSPYGGTFDVDPDGNITGSFKLKTGDAVNVSKDGTITLTSKDGVGTLNPDGSAKMTLNDGSFVSTDSEGNLTGHVELGDGRKADFDGQGNINVKDSQGNSMSMKPDGSFEYIDEDGTKLSGNPKDGSVSYTAPDGTKVVGDPAGNSTLTAPNGNSATVHADGSLTLKTADGKVTNYSADQLKDMKSQFPAGNNP